MVSECRCSYNSWQLKLHGAVQEQLGTIKARPLGEREGSWLAREGGRVQPVGRAEDDAL